MELKLHPCLSLPRKLYCENITTVQLLSKSRVLPPTIARDMCTPAPTRKFKSNWRCERERALKGRDCVFVFAIPAHFFLKCQREGGEGGTEMERDSQVSCGLEVEKESVACLSVSTGAGSAAHRER